METIKTVKVRNCENKAGNGEVKNQFIIDTPDGIYFQSYKTIIALKKNGKVFLDADSWDYSKTTGKYRNEFLHETKTETLKKIKSGEYQLVNLNN
jgi:hypothetical protein